MQKVPMIGIIGVISAIIIVGIAFGLNQGPNGTDISGIDGTDISGIDGTDIQQQEEDPIIQEKLNKIKEIAENSEYTPAERIWQTSGPFQIDRDEYAIGEKIFVRLGGLTVKEKGEIAVLRLLNMTHYKVYTTIPFDGSEKSTFNYYFEPQISSKRGLCSTQDITGKWTLVFRGTDYENLDFNITDKVVPGTDIESVC